MARKKKQTVGYRYFANAHMVLCHGPIDAITKISFSEKDAYKVSESENKTITIDKPSLFGGDDQQGGIRGKIDLMFGHSDQVKNTKLQTICAKISDSFGGVVSAWRGVTSVFLDNLYIGTSPNMPDSKWRVKRTQIRHDGIEQWYPERADIITIPDNVLIEDLAFAANLATTDGSAGITISSGFTAKDYLIVEKPKGLTYKAWSEWATDTDGNMHEPGKPWCNRIAVTSGSSAFVEYWDKWFATQDEAEAYASNRYFILTGSESYKFWINDIPPTDNRGGVSLKVYIGGQVDLNPAHIIRECLTNPIWGIGIAEDGIDDDSFMAAADTLYDERMGMSIKWTDSTAISEFVDTVKQHINAQLHLDRITNKWKLYLIRDDYEKDALVSVDEGEIQDLEFERRTLAECTNTVTVTYYDVEKSGDSTVSVQDIARIAQQGGVIAQGIEYTGFSNSNIAGRVALRELKTLSSTLASVSFNISETLSNEWHIGMPFKLSDNNYGLDEAIMRVTAIKFGNGISNTVYVEAVEDSFSSPAQAVVEYVPPIVSDSSAKDAMAIAFEVPFIELVEQYGQDEINAKLLAENDLGFVGMAAIRPNNLHINASLYSDSGAGFDEEAALDFCPNATLKTEISYTDSTFEVESVTEFELLEVNNRLQLNDEILAFVSFDSTTNMLTVKRGCFDGSAPRIHAAGSVIYGWDNYSGLDGTEYLSGETVNLKALTLTGSDSLSLSEATAHSITLGSRAIRPYPPANVQINGEYFPAEIETDLILTWETRNRQQQTGGTPISWFEGGISSETDVTYQLVLIERDVSNIELRTQNINVNTLNTYTFATSAMNSNTRTIEITLKSLRNGYECYQPFNHTVELSQFFSAPYNLAYTVRTV